MGKHLCLWASGETQTYRIDIPTRHSAFKETSRTSRGTANMKFTKLTLLATVVAGASYLPVYAQDSEEGEIEEVVVTGSRLNVNPNLTSANPVLAVGKEEIDARGIVSIEDLTNSLPQISAAQTAEQSNGATGTSQIDLRGLGAVRTLALIDGRRLPYGDSNSSAANIDLVPTQLVERIDVVTCLLYTSPSPRDRG